MPFWSVAVMKLKWNKKFNYVTDGKGGIKATTSLCSGVWRWMEK